MKTLFTLTSLIFMVTLFVGSENAKADLAAPDCASLKTAVKTATSSVKNITKTANTTIKNYTAAQKLITQLTKSAPTLTKALDRKIIKEEIKLNGATKAKLVVLKYLEELNCQIEDPRQKRNCERKKAKLTFQLAEKELVIAKANQVLTPLNAQKDGIVSRHTGRLAAAQTALEAATVARDAALSERTRLVYELAVKKSEYDAKCG